MAKLVSLLFLYGSFANLLVLWLAKERHETWRQAFRRFYCPGPGHVIVSAGLAVFTILGLAYLQQSGLLWVLVPTVVPPLAVYIAMTLVVAFVVRRDSPIWMYAYAGLWMTTVVGTGTGWFLETSNKVHLWATVPRLTPVGAHDPAFCHGDDDGRYFVLIGPWDVDNSAWYVYDPAGIPPPGTRSILPFDIATGKERGWVPIWGNWFRLSTKGYNWPKSSNTCR